MASVCVPNVRTSAASPPQGIANAQSHNPSARITLRRRAKRPVRFVGMQLARFEDRSDRVDHAVHVFERTDGDGGFIASIVQVEENDERVLGVFERDCLAELAAAVGGVDAARGLTATAGLPHEAEDIRAVRTSLASIACRIAARTDQGA